MLLESPSGVKYDIQKIVVFVSSFCLHFELFSVVFVYIFSNFGNLFLHNFPI